MCKAGEDMRPGGDNGFIPSDEEMFIINFEQKLGI